MASLPGPAAPGAVGAVWAPYSTVVPYWKKYVVLAPLGLTLPSSEALDGVTFATPPVVTTAFPAPGAAPGSARESAQPRRTASLIGRDVLSKVIPLESAVLR